MKWDLLPFSSLTKQAGGKSSDALNYQFTLHMEQLPEEMKSLFSDIREHVAKDAWVMGPFLTKEDVECLQAEDELMLS